jgi:REP element-mobilizing transposase RayT
MRQIQFGFIQDYKKTFGGEELRGRRKSKRPLSLKSPTHLILKSDLNSVFKTNNQRLQTLIQNIASKFQIHIYDIAINWSHIHFLIQVKDRKDYIRFIRALTSKLVMGVKKARPHLKAKLFTLRPFTRIVSWGRDFQNVRAYIIKNFFEANRWTRREKIEKKTEKSKSQKKRGVKKTALDSNSLSATSQASHSLE